jgi:hypothetical protein
MPKFYAAFLLLLLSSMTHVYSQEEYLPEDCSFTDCCSYNSPRYSSTLAFSGGYRQDKYRFTISSADVPGSYTKYRWDKERFWQIGVSYNLVTCTNFVFNVEADYGSNYQGRFHETNSAAPAVTYFSGRSRHNHVSDISVGLGYKMGFCDESLFVIPYVGWANHEQRLRVPSGSSNTYADGVLTTSQDYPDLHGRHRAKWWGPTLGGYIASRITCNWYMWAGYFHTFAEFHASSRNLNLSVVGTPNIDRLRAHASGDQWRIGTSYALCGYTFFVQADAQRFRAHRGRDTLLSPLLTAVDSSSSGTSFSRTKQPLKNVHWTSWQVMAGFGWNF